jgi:transcriptional regulator with XRE-family HTH domain
MAKSLAKIRARQLRTNGQSIKDIARKLKVSQSTASNWCHDIKLSKKQIDKLIKSKEKKITAGRLKGALVQKMKKINAIQWAEKQAEALKNLSTQEFFIAGLVFYLAEGTKASGVVQFTNSDPRIVNFMLRWFRKFYNVTARDIRCSILINVDQKRRENKAKRFWQKYLKIPPVSFTKTRYAKSKQRKIYANQNSYFGTFNFRVSKSTKLLYLINALTNRLLSI